MVHAHRAHTLSPPYVPVPPVVASLSRSSMTRTSLAFVCCATGRQHSPTKAHSGSPGDSYEGGAAAGSRLAPYHLRVKLPCPPSKHVRPIVYTIPTLRGYRAPVVHGVHSGGRRDSLRRTPNVSFRSPHLHHRPPLRKPLRRRTFFSILGLECVCC